MRYPKAHWVTRGEEELALVPVSYLVPSKAFTAVRSSACLGGSTRDDHMVFAFWGVTSASLARLARKAGK